MAEETKNIETNPYLEILKTFPRDKEFIQIDKYKFRIRFLSTDELTEIRKYSEKVNDLFEVHKMYLLKGLVEWNLTDEQGNLLPITKENIGKLPGYVVNAIAICIIAKNRDLTPDEITTIINF